jgi:hypothetical protein
MLAIDAADMKYYNAIGDGYRLEEGDWLIIPHKRIGCLTDIPIGQEFRFTIYTVREGDSLVQFIGSVWHFYRHN